MTGSGFTGGDGGTPGGASVTNTGSITTQGLGSMGIRVSVVGGAGGNGGAAGPWSGHGGNGGGGGNTGQLAVTIQNDGNISTAGKDALGILAHAVGGGAGSADVSQGLMNIGGGAGGNGGLGGNIQADSNGSIFTTGDQSAGALIQSIGGGGGHGGDADTTGIIVGVATGGHGGAGGAGGHGHDGSGRRDLDSGRRFCGPHSAKHRRRRRRGWLCQRDHRGYRARRGGQPRRQCRGGAGARPA